MANFTEKFGKPKDSALANGAKIKIYTISKVQYEEIVPDVIRGAITDWNGIRVKRGKFSTIFNNGKEIFAVIGI